MRLLAVLVTLLTLVACWGKDAYIVEGTVLEVRSPTQIVVDHEEVQGLMGPMIMPFRLADPAMSEGLEPGSRIVARLLMKPDGATLDKVRVTGKVDLPAPPAAEGPEPLRAGAILPRTEIPVTGGETWVVGEGQPKPTALTFLYTTCPMPEFCPLTVTRLQGLQAAVGQDARILAVTIDLVGDSMAVLDAFATTTGADPAVWRFGRLEGPAFKELVQRAALPFGYNDLEVVHSLRLLVLDADGRLVERYDDNAWPLERVVEQLKTGGPPAPPGSDGTVSKIPEP